MTKRAPSTFGPYLVHEELGTGGMATVHRAELPGVEGFSKMVALKRMLPRVAKNEELVKSFVREAHLASYLHHANLAEIYELGQHDGVYFIAMELITGRSLNEIISQCVYDKPMPVAIALDIVRQLCDALDYAHTLADGSGQPLGLIHRDVSPANIIVAETGVVKLIDFGIAKASIEGMQTKSVTVKGKFGYMAPEYIATGQLDSRADLFAVGVVAHELLANQPLFSGGEDVDAVLKLRSLEIVPPSKRNPQVPPDVDDIIMTALARDPEARWQRASAMHDALRSTVKRHNLGVVPADVVAWLDDMFQTDNFADSPATEIETHAYPGQAGPAAIAAKILPTSPPPGVAKLPARGAPRPAVVPVPAAQPARAAPRPSVQIPVPALPKELLRAAAAPSPTRTQPAATPLLDLELALAPEISLAPEPAPMPPRTMTPVPPRATPPAPRVATPLPAHAPSPEPARFTPAPVITRTEQPTPSRAAPVPAPASRPIPAPASLAVATLPTQPQTIPAPPPADDDDPPQWTDDTGVETIVRVTDPGQMAALDAAHNAARAAAAARQVALAGDRTQPAQVLNPSSHAAHVAHAATIHAMDAVVPQADLAQHMRELESSPAEAPPPLPIFDTQPPRAPLPSLEVAPPPPVRRSRTWLLLLAIVLTGAAAGVAVYFLT